MLAISNCMLWILALNAGLFSQSLDHGILSQEPLPNGEKFRPFDTRKCHLNLYQLLEEISHIGWTVFVVTFRQYRLERELTSQLWKIDPNDLYVYDGRAPSCSSFGSIVSLLNSHVLLLDTMFSPNTMFFVVFCSYLFQRLVLRLKYTISLNGQFSLKSFF